MLLDGRLVNEITHPEWVANVVLVKKLNGKYRMCIDYTNLKKACSKDNNPLLIIDNLVDSIAYNGLYSFINATQGYH